MNNKIDSRLILMLIWVLFFLTNIILIVLLKVNHWLIDDQDDFKYALTALNNAYSPYLGVILVYYWNKRNLDNYPFNAGFFLASIMSVIWNLTITFLLAQLLSGNGEFRKNLDLIKDLGGLFSWLVAGAVGFYFGKDKPS